MDYHHFGSFGAEWVGGISSLEQAKEIGGVPSDRSRFKKGYWFVSSSHRNG